MTLADRFNPDSRADMDLRFAWMFLGGTFVALVLNGIWSLYMGTSSFGGDEDELVRGWEGVLRNLPAYLLLVGVAATGVWFATQAGIHGASSSRRALVATSLVLLFALNSVTRDAAEVVMTTRAATVAWLLFALDAALVGSIFLIALGRIRSVSGR
jgi:hypothetical protein